jgi:hypothetical protein
MQRVAQYQNLIELLIYHQNPSPLALGGHFSLVPLAVAPSHVQPQASEYGVKYNTMQFILTGRLSRTKNPCLIR